MEISLAHDQPPLLYSENQCKAQQQHSCPLCSMALSRIANQDFSNFYINMIFSKILSLGSFFLQQWSLDILCDRLHYTLTSQKSLGKSLNASMQRKRLYNEVPILSATEVSLFHTFFQFSIVNFQQMDRKQQQQQQQQKKNKSYFMNITDFVAPQWVFLKLFQHEETSLTNVFVNFEYISYLFLFLLLILIKCLHQDFTFIDNRIYIS